MIRTLGQVTQQTQVTQWIQRKGGDRKTWLEETSSGGCRYWGFGL